MVVFKSLLRLTVSRQFRAIARVAINEVILQSSMRCRIPLKRALMIGLGILQLVQPVTSSSAVCTTNEQCSSAVDNELDDQSRTTGNKKSIHSPCAVSPSAKDLWARRGDVNRFFSGLIRRSQPYHPRIHAGPTTQLYDLSTERLASLSPKVLEGGPWVVELRNLTLYQEHERLVKLATRRGFSSSRQTTNDNQGPIENTNRTSSTSWCVGDCFQDEIVQNVTRRLEHILGIPTNHSEYMQILRYTEGQEYHNHHDLIPQHVNRPYGVRILTVLLYLSDVPAGGGTHFPHLGLTILPRAGTALVWPNVWNRSPQTMDPRTIHRALPVSRGTKYAANVWVHQRDYKTPHDEGCTIAEASSSQE